MDNIDELLLQLDTYKLSSNEEELNKLEYLRYNASYKEYRNYYYTLWRKKNKDKLQERKHKYNANRRIKYHTDDHMKNIIKNYRKNNKDKIFEYSFRKGLKNKFNLTIEEYE